MFALSPTKRHSTGGTVPTSVHDSPKSSRKSPPKDLPAASKRYSVVNEINGVSDNVFLEVPEVRAFSLLYSMLYLAQKQLV